MHRDYLKLFRFNDNCTLTLLPSPERENPQIFVAESDAKKEGIGLVCLESHIW